jgi:hypothetical protein
MSIQHSDLKKVKKIDDRYCFVWVDSLDNDLFDTINMINNYESDLCLMIGCDETLSSDIKLLYGFYTIISDGSDNGYKEACKIVKCIKDLKGFF